MAALDFSRLVAAQGGADVEAEALALWPRVRAWLIEVEGWPAAEIDAMRDQLKTDFAPGAGVARPDTLPALSRDERMVLWRDWLLQRVPPVPVLRHG